MSLGKRIKELRLEREMTQSDLADALKVARSNISKYENNLMTPSMESLNKMSTLFHVSLDYLLDKEDTDTKRTTPIRVPVHSVVPAGVPLEALEDVVDWEELNPEEFSPNHDYIGLIVRGDSMYPRYLEGDIVIVRIQPDCESGQDAVVYINGYDATLKTVYKHSNNRIELRPVNNNHPPKIYGPESEPITILGVVVQLRRNMH